MGLIDRPPTEAEIAVLEALAAQGETVLATPESGAPAFRARLCAVDPSRRHILLDAEAQAPAPAALRDMKRVAFLVEWGEWRIGFTATNPSHSASDGIGFIRFDFPVSASISRRRMLERAPVPRSAPLRCVAYAGATPILEATITDISQGGIGMQVESARKALEPGMVLPGCLIERAGREPVVVDLEVRHTSMNTLEDGRRVLCAGCRFQNLSPAGMGLVAECFAAKFPKP